MSDHSAAAREHALDERVIVVWNGSQLWVGNELRDVERVVVRAPADPHAGPLELVCLGFRPAAVERIDGGVEMPQHSVEIATRPVGDDRTVEDVGEVEEPGIGEQEAELELGVPRRLVEIGRGRRVEPAARDPGVGDVLALYHLGSLAPLGPADRQRMLDAATLAERLTVFAGALDDAAAVVRFRSA